MRVVGAADRQTEGQRADAIRVSRIGATAAAASRQCVRTMQMRRLRLCVTNHTLACLYPHSIFLQLSLRVLREWWRRDALRHKFVNHTKYIHMYVCAINKYNCSCSRPPIYFWLLIFLLLIFYFNGSVLLISPATTTNNWPGELFCMVCVT